MLVGRSASGTSFDPALRATADFTAAEWQAQRYEVAAQTYEVYGTPCANLEVTRRGTKVPSETILVGAGYDSVLGSLPTTMAAAWPLLEMSRYFAGEAPERTVRFVAS
jgi:hypothetical protein